ncbi:MAG: terminase small subunit, partial [Eubacterium sp.]
MRAAFAIKNFEGGIYTARKKKTTKDEVREGLKRLAFGEIKDAVLLLFAQEGDILSQLPGLDLYNISEIKRPKGGGMEIKFFDRIK